MISGVIIAVLSFAFALIPQVTFAQDDSDSPPYPAPGRLVDIGGWRLHLNCYGIQTADAPTVILESGVGDLSVEWSLVQPGVARFARVCSYDRAGDGRSELGPFPRTFRQIVYELHTLLDSAGERPPFVLVGHSYGGWLVRLYQMTYSSQVVGMVLVEGGADDPRRMTADGRIVHASDLATSRPVPPVKTSGPLKLSEIPAAVLAQMRAGLPDAKLRANEPPRDKLPLDAQRAGTWAADRLGHIIAAVNPFENEELAALRAASAKTEYPVGDLPLIVITRGKPEETGRDSATVEAQNRRDHQRIASLSHRGKLVVAECSGHHVQLEQPDLVVSMIREVVAQSREFNAGRDASRIFSTVPTNVLLVKATYWIGR